MEITQGNLLDSVIGLFDPSGNLIATDDDGGTGLLSRLVFPITTSGIYSFAISAFADFDFNGDGGSGGRYVMDVSVIDGIPLTLGDDSSVEVNLGFSFPFQGDSHSSVFVNANGSLTFGAGDSEWNESVGGFLADPPRIAPFWDDLSPNAGGDVIVDGDSNSFTVSFQDVPEFIATGANSFDVTLHSDGTIVFDYGSLTAVDALVGLSPGGNLEGDPGATDLSAAGSLSADGVTYELFTLGGPFDLSGTTIQFDP